ncbi:MAG: Hsp20/alpha crystallin family protein [Verrucomicrobia bacterium]|nr:Hsp20/alpha crystallin family protein [Verrucomicrobiota bacterium]
MKPETNTLERSQTSRMPSWELPPANIREEHEAYLLELEMPGVSKNGIEVTVENNELTIVGHRQDEPPKGEVVYRESRHGDYRRSFEIDTSIDTGKISAKMEQGILKLTLPKAESVKPRKIQVVD